jgi:hypothetical protein
MSLNLAFGNMQNSALVSQPLQLVQGYLTPGKSSRIPKPKLGTRELHTEFLGRESCQLHGR